MKYEWIVGTTTYNLSDSIPFEVKEIDGIDLPPVSVITEQGPLQDGDSEKDYRLDTRTILMLIQARTTEVYTHESNRMLFNRAFKPSRLKGTLQITQDSGSVFAITARCLGNLGLKRSLISEQMAIGAVTLRCADPIWYDPTLQSETFGLATGSSGFTVPTPVPTFVGTSTLDQTKLITYLGTYREFPILQVYGPITDCLIENLTTGHKIDFDGYTIGNGDHYTIDLRYGRKFVYKNDVTTDLRTNETTNDSNLATFCLESDPDVPNGENVFRVSGSSVNVATQVFIQYYRRYIGH